MGDTCTDKKGVFPITVNPEGIWSFSPRLRAASYLGYPDQNIPILKGLRHGSLDFSDTIDCTKIPLQPPISGMRTLAKEIYHRDLKNRSGTTKLAKSRLRC